MNGDRRLDVAGASFGTSTVSVLLNNGKGGLEAPIEYAAAHGSAEDFELADVSGDGRDDLIVLYSVLSLSVRAQLARGGFGPAATYPVGTHLVAQGIGVGDVTGDGRNDVVASYGGNRPSSFIAVLAQTAAGTLAPPTPYPSYDVPEPVEVADVTRDGREDVVTLHGGWLAAGVYTQHSTGVLVPEELYPIPDATHYNAHGMAVGDINRDFAPDIVLADYNHGLVVLRSTLGTPNADLALEVSASARRLQRLRTFSFAAKVTNDGPETTPASLVLTVIGPRSPLVTGNPECTVQTSTVRCSFAELAAGASRTVRVWGIATRRGTLAARATVDGDELDPKAANNGDGATITVL